MAIEFDFEQRPFGEALEFFQQKDLLPTTRWNDILREQHERAFVVAGAMRMDMLSDFQQAVQAAIEDGETLEDFRARFDDIVARYGWDFNGGRDWRSQLIYRTNLRTSYQAGRRAQMLDEDVVEARPFWQYRHGGSLEPREEHFNPPPDGFNGLVLRHDDPFWDTHYPPNGFGCSCGVFSLSPDDLERRGLEVGASPEIETYEWTDRRTGEVHDIPRGIDPGWDYAPGEGWMRSQTKTFVDEWPGSAEDVPDVHVFGPEPSDPPLPRTVEASIRMDEGLSEEDYLRAFFDEFGTSPDEPTIFEDVIGERIVISDHLFREAGGRLKVTKRGREPWVRLLARTITRPDEIWVTMDRFRNEPRRWKTARHYVARWDVEGEDTPAISIFEFIGAHWTGVTTFDPDAQSEFERRRRGIRLYRRRDD